MATFLLCISLLNLVFWLGLGLDRSRRWPAALALGSGQRPAPSAGPAPPVAVIVPARNEEAVISRSLGSLLAQPWPALRIFVVDDGSEDRTSEVVARLGARSGLHTLELLAASLRPHGWSGKVNALHSGVARMLATQPATEWLLFTDADIEHPTGAVAALLERAAEGPYDAVSVMARLHAESRWEKLLIPPFVFFFHLLYPFERVRRSGSRVAAAAGGCILVRRSALERAGGLRAIAGAVIDDVALARALKSSGSRLWLGLDPGIASIRPYRSLAELWVMVARSAFVQLRYRWSLLAAVVVGIGIFFVSPPFILALGFVGLSLSGPDSRLLFATFAAGLVWALQAWALLPAVRHHRVPAAWALTLPLAALLYAAMTVGSALDHLRGRSSAWKGRVYSQDPEV